MSQEIWEDVLVNANEKYCLEKMLWSIIKILLSPTGGISCSPNLTFAFACRSSDDIMWVPLYMCIYGLYHVMT